MENEEKKTVSAAVSNWIAKNRFILLGVVVALFVVAVTIGVVGSVGRKNREKGFTKLDSLYYQLTSIQSSDDAAQEDEARKESEILQEAYSLASANSKNAVGSRAYMLVAEIEFKNGEYAKARDAWNNAASANEKAYTAPLSWYNAAICSEELGDIDAALANIGKAVARSDFAAKPRALFNAGRMEEQRGGYAAAQTYYNTLVDDFNGDSWAALAKTRLIALETEGKIH